MSFTISLRGQAKRRGASRPGRTVAIGLAVAAVALTGCGDSSSGSEDDDKGSGSADVAAAQKILDAAQTRPTTITQTVPITEPIPADKKLVFLSCGVETCEKTGELLRPGADALGWSLEIVTTDGTPEQVSSAFTSAIRSGADAVIYPTADIAQLAAPLKEAEENGVLFATVASLDEPDPNDAYFFAMGGPDYFGKIGEVLAAKVVADSGGSASALYVDLPQFAILTPMNDGFNATLEEECPDCKSDTLDIQASSLGKDAPDLIVSALRRSPDTKYVVLSEASAMEPGLPAALNAAGLNDVKILGQSGSEQVYTDVQSGVVLATVQPEGYSYSFGILDALARSWSGQEVLPIEPNLLLLTKDNIPDDIEGRIAWPAVEDMEAQYLALWGKS